MATEPSNDPLVWIDCEVRLSYKYPNTHPLSLSLHHVPSPPPLIPLYIYIYLYKKKKILDDRPRPNHRHHPLNIMLHHKRPPHPPRSGWLTPSNLPPAAHVRQNVRMVSPHPHRLRPCIILPLPLHLHHPTRSGQIPFGIYQILHPSATHRRFGWEFCTYGSGLSYCC